ncbi:MAG TPA: hypothetical protein VHH72_09600 [Solirubrobacterales bacterium]|jgi:hypothetical protein|nr:hypothetical protein [Solirubrobacterales bacterium]
MDHFNIAYAADQARQQEMLRAAEAHRVALAARPRLSLRLRGRLAALHGRPARRQAPASPAPQQASAGDAAADCA